MGDTRENNAHIERDRKNAGIGREHCLAQQAHIYHPLATHHG